MRKNDYTRGLEVILNNPKTSFLKNPGVFREIHTQSGMPLTSMMRAIGKSSRTYGNGKRPKSPTDDERTQNRMNTMEAKQNS